MVENNIKVDTERFAHANIQKQKLGKKTLEVFP